MPGVVRNRFHRELFHNTLEGAFLSANALILTILMLTALGLGVVLLKTS